MLARTRSEGSEGRGGGRGEALLRSLRRFQRSLIRCFALPCSSLVMSSHLSPPCVDLCSSFCRCSALVMPQCSSQALVPHFSVENEEDLLSLQVDREELT
eukprot:757160-Hanusia_phi.AAC.7